MMDYVLKIKRMKRVTCVSVNKASLETNARVRQRILSSYKFSWLDRCTGIAGSIPGRGHIVAFFTTAPGWVLINV
jgi:hypothetical protein